MFLTVTANPSGHVAVALQKDGGDGAMCAYKLSPGWDQLALFLVRRELGSFQHADGTYTAPASLIVAAVTRAIHATRVGKVSDFKFGAALKHIRTVVFGTSQQIIGEIVGRDGSTVSRWEDDKSEPTLSEFKRLRDFARAHGLAWDDAAIWDATATKETKNARASHLKAEVGVAS